MSLEAMTALLPTPAVEDDPEDETNGWPRVEDEEENAMEGGGLEEEEDLFNSKCNK
jgi:hypothetical protein